MNQVHVLLYYQYSESSEEFIKGNLETNATLSVSGALDGLSDEDLLAMEADPIATGMPVELGDGSCIYVSHEQIDQRAREAVERLKGEGKDTIMMCCTVPWPSLEELPGVLCPSRVMEAYSVALLPRGGTLGVVQPLAITSEEEIKHWQKLGIPVVAATISPEENSVEELVQASIALVEQGAGLIVLDCLAFCREHWQAVRQATGKPVLLPLSLLGKVLDEAYG